MIAKKVSQNEWYDISIPLKNGMVTWPGDPPVKVKRLLDVDHGDGITLSAISMGTHTGTHMDSPFHFIKGGKGLDEMPFDATIGLARVIEIYDEKSIKIEELLKCRIRKGERVLFKTKNSARCWKSNSFKKDFVYISQDAAEFLANRKIRTVGVDYLSVDEFGHNESMTHMTLLKAGIWIIEGLNLCQIEQGTYQMICLPLKIVNSDGAPARAIVKRVH
jgi:arylformamidase